MKLSKTNFFVEGLQGIPLVLHVSTASLKECRRYEEVFAGLHNAIKESKK